MAAFAERGLSGDGAMDTRKLSRFVVSICAILFLGVVFVPGKSRINGKHLLVSGPEELGLVRMIESEMAEVERAAEHCEGEACFSTIKDKRGVWPVHEGCLLRARLSRGRLFAVVVGGDNLLLVKGIAQRLSALDQRANDSTMSILVLLEKNEARVKNIRKKLLSSLARFVDIENDLGKASSQCKSPRGQPDLAELFECYGLQSTLDILVVNCGDSGEKASAVRAALTAKKAPYFTQVLLNIPKTVKQKTPRVCKELAEILLKRGYSEIQALGKVKTITRRTFVLDERVAFCEGRT